LLFYRELYCFWACLVFGLLARRLFYEKTLCLSVIFGEFSGETCRSYYASNSFPTSHALASFLLSV
jgi:hypothetical protein